MRVSIASGHQLFRLETMTGTYHTMQNTCDNDDNDDDNNSNSNNSITNDDSTNNNATDNDNTKQPEAGI